MAIIRSFLSHRVRFGVNQALRPTISPSSPSPTSVPASTAAPVGNLMGSRRHLRVTHTPPQTPPMPPMDLRYNYAAGVFIVVLFTWAALSPEDDGFNTLLGGGKGQEDDEDDDDDDDDDDERYDGTGYEGRDKALAGSAGGVSAAGAGGSGRRGGGGGAVRD